jgi:hypothetical protein
MQSNTKHRPAALAAQCIALVIALSLPVGCGGGGGGGPADVVTGTVAPGPVPETTGPTAPVPDAPTPVTPVPAAQAPLSCDDSMKTSFVPDANTKVLMVRFFSKGEPLSLTGLASAERAANDLCMVKLNVGPGHPGPAGAPSTSAGIGIEIWLPTPANWNGRIHVKGGTGWAGGGQGSVSELGIGTAGAAGSPAETAGNEGAVSATTDTGHAVGNGSFATNPDGSINTALWLDFSSRGAHEMAVKTKALTRAYYGRDARFTYFNGFSTGGRQGLMEAQAHPEDFDGILAGAPAINRTQLVVGQLYPQIVMQRDLAGVLLTPGQRSLVSNAAISACDVVGGQHLGYVLDPATCRYDPTSDPSVICAANGGANATGNCVTPTQALAFNKFWYGPTPDGSVPSPAADNGFWITLSGAQKWYGPTRGSLLDDVAGPFPFSIATEMVSLQLQDRSWADRWRSLTYGQLANAADSGSALQGAFGNIDSNNPDLSGFRNRGGKMLMYHGFADGLVPPQGSIHYYNRVANLMGGFPAIQDFYRFFLVPGMGHTFSNGTANPSAAPPVPSNAQLYSILTDWVERGVAPGSVRVTAFPTQKTGTLCLYPSRPTYVGGDPNQAGSYRCS